MTLDNLICSKKTRGQLQALTTDMPHAILLVGADGMGKRAVALTSAQTVTNAGNIAIIEPDEKGTIGIETIRQLYQRTRSRQDGRQIVIIDHAEAMGMEAQNAFLKLLEEPRPGVSFILTAPTDDALLATITSRTQMVQLPRLNKTAMQQLVAGADHTPQALAQLLFIADGRPGMCVRLRDEPETLAHYTHLMSQAKNLLAAPSFERLAALGNLAKNREDAIALLEAMARMLHVQLLRSPADGLLDFADAVQQTLARLAQNGNPRAQLTALFARN